MIGKTEIIKKKNRDVVEKFFCKNFLVELISTTRKFFQKFFSTTFRFFFFLGFTRAGEGHEGPPGPPYKMAQKYVFLPYRSEFWSDKNSETTFE